MGDRITGDIALFGQAGIGLFFDQRRAESRRLLMASLRPWRGEKWFQKSAAVKGLRKAHEDFVILSRHLEAEAWKGEEEREV